MWTCLLFLFIELTAGDIIGGAETDILMHPYAVSLQADGSHVCGGAIISKNVIVSAAHCIRFKPDAYAVRVGSTYSGEGGDLYNVSQIITHPKYNRRTTDNDICLIYLSEDITFSLSASPIALPPANEVFPDYLITSVCGWGTTSATDSYEIWPVLKAVFLPLVEVNRCRTMFPPKSITDNMLCAWSEWEEDSCDGDSGGPMVAFDKLIGIVSWSFSCAGSTPGVYTNVMKMLPFIYDNTHLVKA